MIKALKTIAVLCLFLLAGCVGEQGDIGPQGPAGAQGARGIKGSKGPSGAFPNLITGIQTVKVSDWKNFSFMGEGQPHDSYYYVIPVKDLTSSIINQGSVKVYMMVDGIEASFPLPRIQEGLHQIAYTPIVENGQGFIEITLLPLSVGAKASKLNADVKFRWTLTPGI